MVEAAVFLGIVLLLILLACVQSWRYVFSSSFRQKSLAQYFRYRATLPKQRLMVERFQQYAMVPIAIGLTIAFLCFLVFAIKELSRIAH
jgi:hypothetical protein